MALFDFLGRRKIKEIHYFSEENKELNLPKMKAQLSKLDSSAEASVSFGEINVHKKITIPEGGDVNKLVQLDMMQYTLAGTINTLNGKDKQEKTKEYVDLLLDMFKLVLSTIATNKEENNNSQDSNTEKKKFNGKLLKKYLDQRGFSSAFLPDDLYTESGYVIWPITLQPSVTYIHTAQIQLIKLLVLSGWKLHVIIGDCGKHSTTVKQPINFKNAIEAILLKNNILIDNQTVTFLSKYFKRDPNVIDESLIKNATSLELLNTFHTISESVVWSDYFEYITKNYNKVKKEEIRKRKVLNNIQPLLNWTVVTTIVNTEINIKAIVVAGEDERKQWHEIVKTHGNNRIGMIYIQELKEQNKTMDQSEINIENLQDMLNKIDRGNMGEWLYNHFIELPRFISNCKPEFCKITENECTKHQNNCIKCLFSDAQNFTNPDFNKTSFATKVYEVANPANSIN
ncbi:MAG: hypothetical protein E6767_16850 [Dysgonomonas sp.]|nr:hypothetical protein [Dysgonomonas sp.]